MNLKKDGCLEGERKWRRFTPKVDTTEVKEG